MTKISIDKLTVLGDFSDVNSDLEYFLANTEYMKHRGFSKYPYRDYVTFLDGSILQIAEKGAVRSGKVQGLRYEFNPKHTTFEKIHMAVLRHFKHARFSRIDIAMDFFDIDMTSWQWLDRKSRKQKHIISGLGQKETVYLGGVKADLTLRIYNKAVEQGEEDKTWWRVEVEMRRDVADTYRRLSSQGEVSINPFEDITPIQRKDFDHLPLKERAMLSYLLDNPEAFGELSKVTRSKYKKMMKNELRYDLLDLKKIWHEKSPELGSELDSWYKLTDMIRFT